MSFVEQHSRSLVNVPLGWLNSARCAFRHACEYEGIDPESKFVVFSEENPYAKFIDKAMEKYWETTSEALVFGYVGLEMHASKKKKGLLPKQKSVKL